MAARLPRTPCIALLTDFGTADWYAACMKGVILRLCPRARIVDITHAIPPQDITAGAFVLAAAAPWFPAGTIFACVVDPGVGTSRRMLAAQADGHLFVGPDNGLLSLVFERAQRLAMVRLTNSRYWLAPVSQTFHGRDVIAPVAAHLACGRPLKHLGIPVRRYTTLSGPPLRRASGRLVGRIVYIDRFGNLITNLPAALIRPRPPARIRYHRRPIRVVSSYGDGRPGELVAITGSLGYVELAIPNASAALRTRATRGERVELLISVPRRRR